MVQFNSVEGLKTLLVSPSDWEHQRATPFFKRLDESYGPFTQLAATHDKWRVIDWQLLAPLRLPP